MPTLHRRRVFSHPRKFIQELPPLDRLISDIISGAEDVKRDLEKLTREAIESLPEPPETEPEDTGREMELEFDTEIEPGDLGELEYETPKESGIEVDVDYSTTDEQIEARELDSEVSTPEEPSLYEAELDINKEDVEVEDIELSSPPKSEPEEVDIETAPVYEDTDQSEPPEPDTSTALESPEVEQDIDINAIDVQTEYMNVEHEASEAQLPEDSLGELSYQVIDDTTDLEVDFDSQAVISEFGEDAEATIPDIPQSIEEFSHESIGVEDLKDIEIDDAVTDLSLSDIDIDIIDAEQDVEIELGTTPSELLMRHRQLAVFRNRIPVSGFKLWT